MFLQAVRIVSVHLATRSAAKIDVDDFCGGGEDRVTAVLCSFCGPTKRVCLGIQKEENMCQRRYENTLFP